MIRDNRWTLRIATWKTYRKTGEMLERRTRRLMDGCHLAEDSAR
ncbi:hypothetical protein NP493_531g04068 [Ridgeia piscesae]|uniref:Uncharacterized protein n=1 Tax=Ridgeia piscesae TaxID=27915 RepID=A0AAD9NTC3_RIDPI|nr:hypothetical protein NP493_531g04068 [Ridgeia piscesae]